MNQRSGNFKLLPATTIFSTEKSTKTQGCSTFYNIKKYADKSDRSNLVISRSPNPGNHFKYSNQSGEKYSVFAWRIPYEKLFKLPNKR